MRDMELQRKTDVTDLEVLHLEEGGAQLGAWGCSRIFVLPSKK
jgi:hypothetical protein